MFGALSRLQSGKRWGTWRVKKGYFPSHTGSPLSVCWCWITQRKRNLRVKGQESLTSEGGGYRESLSENFDLSGYEERVTSEVSLTMCSNIIRLSSCFWNSVHLRTFINVVSAIWHNSCSLDRKCLFISALFSLLTCSSSYSFLLSSKYRAWKQFVLPKENTIVPHSYTHDFQRMPWMCSQRGKKNSVPSKVQTNCPLWGISQSSHVKWDAWEGLVWKNKEKDFNLEGEKKKPWTKQNKTRWAKRLPINVNEGLFQTFFFPPFSMKQEVRW